MGVQFDGTSTRLKTCYCNGEAGIEVLLWLPDVLFGIKGTGAIKTFFLGGGTFGKGEKSFLEFSFVKPKIFSIWTPPKRENPFFRDQLFKVRTFPSLVFIQR